MANFYWYGGTGSWSQFLTHWSGNSGNSPASPKLNAPTSSDDIFIDSNSGFGGGGTITIDADTNAECHDFTSNANDTYTITSTSYEYIYINGSFTLESGVTWDVFFTLFIDDAGAKTFTIAGAILTNPINFSGTGGGGWTLQDDLVCSSEFQLEGGVFDANDHNVTADYFFLGSYNPVTLTMGSGIWTLTGTGFIVNVYESFTLNCETSTIKFTDATSSTKFFKGEGKTFYKLWLTGAGTGAYQIFGSNTFNEFKMDTPPHTIQFEDGATQTVSSFPVAGTVGNLIVINSVGGKIVTWTIATPGTGYSVDEVLDVYSDDNSSDAEFIVTSVDGNGGITGLSLTQGGNGFLVSQNAYMNGGNYDAEITVDTVSLTQHTLSKASGTVISDYLDISNSNATGGASWYAGSHSADTTNNDGWLFEDAPTSSMKDLIQSGIIAFPR